MTESGAGECCYAKDRDKEEETDTNCSVSHKLHCRQESAVTAVFCLHNGQVAKIYNKESVWVACL